MIDVLIPSLSFNFSTLYTWRQNMSSKTACRPEEKDVTHAHQPCRYTICQSWAPETDSRLCKGMRNTSLIEMAIVDERRRNMWVLLCSLYVGNGFVIF